MEITDTLYLKAALFSFPNLWIKDIVKAIKDSKVKVQASIQGDAVRVSGKKRDDLQETISLLKEKDFDLPLQFVNFRD